MTTETLTEINNFQDWASIALRQHWEKIISHEEAVIADKDPEELHQMRVGMRRLRSAINGFASILILPKAANNKRIGQIAQVLGQLRDIDVMQENLANYLPNLSAAEQKRMNQALKYLGKKRKIALKKVQQILRSKQYHQLKEALHNWLENPYFESIGVLPIKEVLPDLLLPEISKILLHSAWLVGVKIDQTQQILFAHKSPETLGELMTTDGYLLHDLRKQAKRVRYQMSLFVEFYGDNYHGYLGDVKKIQEYLGNIQDGVVLSEFLQHFFRDNLSDIMPNLVSQLSQSRWENWKNWRDLQARYLQTETRRGFHASIWEIK